MCASLYKLFLSHLKDQSYDPVGSKVCIANRLFAMYHAKIDDTDKDSILSSLRDVNGKCRLVFCTVAFGMGVNIPNIRYVIHYGPPTDIDDYYQECGRGGQDGEQSFAMLYLYGGCTIGHVSPKMKEFCQLTKGCRRLFLLTQFTSDDLPTDNYTCKHLCCDLCTLECQCTENDKCSYLDAIEVHVHAGDSDNQDDHQQGERSVSQIQR